MTDVGVGMLGYAFMGKAHSNAFKTISYMTWPPPLEPRLVGIAGRDEKAVGEAAQRYGYEYATTDWRELIADDRIGQFFARQAAAIECGANRVEHRGPLRSIQASALIPGRPAERLGLP